MNYVASDLSNPGAANAFLDEVDQCYTLPKQTPQMYALCNDRRLTFHQYRKVVIGSYVLIYRYDEATDTVIILRVFYAARGYAKL